MGVTVFFFMVWMMFLLVATSNPTSALLFFMGVVISSMYLFFWFLGDLLSYLIYLVYIGGLLVLLIYMVMISSNTIHPNEKTWMLFSISAFLMVVSLITDPSKTTSCPASVLDFPFDFFLLSLMGFFLFFSFVYMCNIISVGGRSMNIGNTS